MRTRDETLHEVTNHKVTADLFRTPVTPSVETALGHQSGRDW